MLIWMLTTLQHEKRSGWTVKCSAWDSVVTCSSLKGATVLCLWARHFILYPAQNMDQEYYNQSSQLGKEYTNMELLHGKTNNSAKIIPESFVRDLNGVSLAGRWWPNIECWLGSFVIFHRIWTSISKKPQSLVIFQRGHGPRICTQ